MVVEPFKHFCANTSLRGVRRISSGHNYCVRIFWFSFVLVCTCILSVNMYQNLKVYLSEPTIFLSQLQPLNTQSFPAVSFCFRNRFSEEGYRLFENGEIMSPDNYSRTVRRVTLNLTSFPMTLNYDTYDGYFQNLNMDQLRKVSHNISHIFFCILMTRRGIHHYSPVAHNNCVLEISEFWHSSQFACFRLTVQANLTRSVKTVLIAVKDTKSPPAAYAKHSAFAMPYENLSPVPSSGIKLLVHDEHEPPDMSNGVSIPSGTSTNVEFGTIVVRRLPHRCLSRPKAHQHNHGVVGSECDSDSFIAHVAKQCGCLRVLHSIVLNNTDGLPFCLRMDFKHVAASLFKLRCMHRQLARRVREKCVPYCKEVFYKIEANSHHITDSDPRHCVIKKIVDLLVTKGGQGNKTIVQAITDVVSRYSSATCSAEVMNSTNMEAWVTVRVSHGHSVVSEQREIVIFTFSNFLSAVGGACSLWLGLTITLLAEIVELVVLMVYKKAEA